MSADTYDIDRRCAEELGVPLDRGALFYAAPAGLRFELSQDGGTRTQKFSRALQRAVPLLDAAFGTGRPVWLDLALPCAAPREPVAQLLAPLAACGLTPPKRYQRRDEYEAARERQVTRIAFKTQSGGADVHAALWAALSHDLGVTPTARVDAYVLDFERRLVAYPYDDRGMDIVAPDPAPLRALHAQFGEWILDYDRARIDAQFA